MQTRLLSSLVFRQGLSPEVGLSWLSALACRSLKALASGLALLVMTTTALAETGASTHEGGGEAALNLPVHQSMREVSELIYETCKTYLVTQGKFIMILWAFIAVVIVLYFGVLSPVQPLMITLPLIVLFSLVGIGGSYGV